MMFSSAVAAEILGVVRTCAAGGWLRLYVGPAGVLPGADGAAPSDTNCCAVLRLADPAFAVPVGNSMSLAPIVMGEVLFDGFPAYFVLFAADGSTIVGVGSIGAGGELQLAAEVLYAGLAIDASGVSLSLVQV